MHKLSTFQLALLISFIVAALGGVALFALGIGPTPRNAIGPVVIWGTVDEKAVALTLESLRTEDERFSEVTYVQKDPRTYSAEFIDALAAGRSPDLFLLPEENLYDHRDKILFIPFTTFSERQFKDAFAEAGEVFLAPAGSAGLPVTIDPLVMYWNRDIFSDASLAVPPRYWDEFFTNIVPKVTQRDQSANIVRSFVAMGEYRNVSHAKDILSALILQTGNPLVFKNETGQVRSVLSNSFDQAEPPADAALRFYTQFSNPTKAVYSWNRSLPDSRQSFLSGDLAIYFGFASEYESLRKANPNLNFDVASMPFSRDTTRRTTIGHVLAFSVPRGSFNPAGAMETALALTSSLHIWELAVALKVPPARRDLLSASSEDPVQEVFYQSAITARAWLDPNDAATEGVFQRMIEGYVSGRLRLSEAVGNASDELSQLLAQ